MSALAGFLTAAAGSWAAPLLARLVRASLAGGLAVVLVYLVCRLAPRLPPALRCGLWWLACLKLVLALVWVRPLPLPLPAALAARLPGAATANSRTADPRAGARGGAAALQGPAAEARPAALAPALPSCAARWAPAGSLALLALWAAGLAAGLVRTAGQLAAARRIRRGARTVDSSALAARFAALARRVGRAHPPRLAVSPEIASPVTIGPWQALVVLPAGRELPPGELEMALCHELLHLRRGDLWLGWVPAAAARLFFFHPLAHLAVREHALAREAACDAEVLTRLAASPAAYARLLLALGVAGRPSSVAALGAAPSSGTLKRRLLMLDSTTRRPRTPWLWLAGAAALAALVPVRIIAQAAPSPAVAAASPAPAIASLPIPVARLAAAFPSPRDTARRVRRAASAEPFVLLSKDGDVTMSGSTADVSRVRGLAGPGGEVLWFRRGGREYVVRDPALLAQARELFAPQQELGAEQGKLGDEQGALGERQGKLGAEQGALGAQLGDLAARAASASDSERQRIDREQKEVSEKMDDLGQQQKDLGRQQEDLGERQGKLGREQERLGHEAEAKLKDLLDDALARGVAQEVR